MEMVTALFTAAIAGAGEAAAALPELGAAAGAAGGDLVATAGTAGTATASALSGFQGTLTAGQMLSQAGMGVASIAQGNINATNADLAAKEHAVRIQADYLKKVGSARVAFAGSGLQIGSGSETGVEDSLKSQEQFESALAAASGKAKAEADHMQGDMGAVSALGGIFKTGADYSISIAKRGLPS